MSTPHDKLFKIAFADPEALRLLLRLALPGELLPALDQATLTLLDPVLPADPAERRVDLLAALSLPDRDYLLDILFEHQSSPHRSMGVRLLDAMVARWRRWTRDHPPGTDLQRIIAIVVYHGPEPWTDPVDFHRRFGPDLTATNPFDAFVPDFRYLLVDLTDPAHQPAKGPVLALLASALFARWSRIKRGAPGTLLDELHACAHLVRKLIATQGRPALAPLIDYILHVEERATELDLHQAVTAITRTQEADVPTIAETIEQRGVEKGIAVGEARGIAVGEAKGLREGLLTAATAAFGPCPPHLRLTLDRADVPTLRDALRRLRAADDWQQLFD